MHRSSNYYLRRLYSGSIVFAPDDGGGSGGSGEGAPADEGGDGKEGESGEGGEGGEGSGEEIKDPEKKRLADEAAKHRREKNETAKQLAAAQKRIKEMEDKDKTELEKAQGDLKTHTERVATLETTNGKLALEVAFLKVANGRFRDPDDALALLDRSKIEIDPAEGTASGVKEAVEKLAKAKPYLLKDDEGGGPSGAPFNKRGGDGKQIDKAKFAERFPAARIPGA